MFEPFQNPKAHATAESEPYNPDHERHQSQEKTAANESDDGISWGNNCQSEDEGQSRKPEEPYRDKQNHSPEERPQTLEMFMHEAKGNHWTLTLRELGSSCHDLMPLGKHGQQRSRRRRWWSGKCFDEGLQPAPRRLAVVRRDSQWCGAQRLPVVAMMQVNPLSNAFPRSNFNVST